MTPSYKRKLIEYLMRVYHRGHKLTWNGHAYCVQCNFNTGVLTAFARLGQEVKVSKGRAYIYRDYARSALTDLTTYLFDRKGWVVGKLRLWQPAKLTHIDLSQREHVACWNCSINQPLTYRGETYAGTLHEKLEFVYGDLEE